MTNTTVKNKLLIDNLPRGWRQMGAEKFSCSKSKIEKVVYGLTTDLEIFAYILTLAEENKKAQTELQLQIRKRLKSLASS
jgi:hypothetical protein